MVRKTLIKLYVDEEADFYYAEYHKENKIGNLIEYYSCEIPKWLYDYIKELEEDLDHFEYHEHEEYLRGYS